MHILHRPPHMPLPKLIPTPCQTLIVRILLKLPSNTPLTRLKQHLQPREQGHVLARGGGDSVDVLGWELEQGGGGFHGGAGALEAVEGVGEL